MSPRVPPSPAADDPRARIVEDHRPWGRFRRYTHGEPTTVKVITVTAGQALSLQRHEHRDELWVVLDPGLQVRIGDEVIDAAVGDEFLIPRGTLHRVAAGSRTRASSRSRSGGSTRTTSNGSRTATGGTDQPVSTASRRHRPDPVWSC
jgi:mannose-6-phosphate isomerase